LPKLPEFQKLPESGLEIPISRFRAIPEVLAILAILAILTILAI
jgi:hypothetical protein